MTFRTCMFQGKDANGYEDYYPFINSPIQMCLALKNDGARKLYWIPCSLHLGSICEGNNYEKLVPNVQVFLYS